MSKKYCSPPRSPFEHPGHLLRELGYLLKDLGAEGFVGAYGGEKKHGGMTFKLFGEKWLLEYSPVQPDEGRGK